MILTEGHISSGNVADFPWLVNGHYSGEFVISPPVDPEEPVEVERIINNWGPVNTWLG